MDRGSWRGSPRLLELYALQGALLLFVLEPMVGRLLLPAFGGGAHVWTTCLVFFQGMLLAGYAWAHFVVPRIGRWHLLALASGCFLLPIGVAADPEAGGPVAAVALALLRDVALPFGLLATTGVVAQYWLSLSAGEEKHDPYFLYAASNGGSLIGLLSYPLLVEPLLGLELQRWLWSLAFGGWLLLAIAVAPPHRVSALAEAGAEDARPPAWGAHVHWLLLSAAPAVLLLAVTNFLSAELGSIPLVWVMPLALYMATFVLAFGRRPWLPRLMARFWPEAALLGLATFLVPAALPRAVVFSAQLLALFWVCLVSHRELHRRRPHPRHLSRFYLVVSAGGFAGGLFVVLGAPQLFTRLYEYPVGMLCVLCVLAFGRRRELRTWMAERRHRAERVLRAALLAPPAALLVAWLLGGGEGQTVAALRNAHGVYRVIDGVHEPRGEGPESIPVRSLVHNGVVHGMQAKEAPWRSRPGTYYPPLGELLGLLPPQRQLAVVGLGAGASAALLEPGDRMIFYELDPDNERLARQHFGYLQAAAGTLVVVAGDARLQLERGAAVPVDGFDALVVDAFSGDAIPTHLLTREAFALYLSRLRGGGLLVFHISNRYYDLRPVLRRAADELGLAGAFHPKRPWVELAPLEKPSAWVVLAREAGPLEGLRAQGWEPFPGGPELRRTRLWTDDHVNVLAPLWYGLTGGELLGPSADVGPAEAE